MNTAITGELAMTENREQMLEKFTKMEAERKIEAVKKIMHYNLPPLELLLGIMMIVEPEKLGELIQILEDQKV